MLVKDIVPGQQNGYRYSQYPYDLTNVGGRLFFRASDGLTPTFAGAELWSTDGTAAGTVRVKDIHPTGSSSPAYLTAVGSVVLFSASEGTNGTELWKSDGTEAGTGITPCWQ